MSWGALCRSVAVAGLGAALGGLLVACGGSSGAAAASSPASQRSVAAATPSASAAPLSPVVKVKVARGGLLGEAGLAIAQARGYFKDEGLDVQFTTSITGPAQIPQLGSGQLDFGSGAPDPSMFNAVARGVAVKIVAPQATTLPGDKHAAFIVRKDLIDSGRVRTPQDLKGLNVGAGPTLGTSAQYLVEEVLKRGGLTAADVTLVALPFADIITALSNKRLDAAWSVEPHIANAERLGLASRFLAVDELSPGALGEGLLLSPDFARSQPEAAKRLVTAQLRGQRDYYRAVEKNGPDRGAIVSILIDDGMVKDAATFDALGQTTVEPNDEINTKVLGDYQDYFVRGGQVKDRVAIDQIVDRSYAEYAVQRLGRI